MALILSAADGTATTNEPMTSRWPTADEATQTEILMARTARDTAIAAAENQLLDTIEAAVGEGRITVSAAAGVTGTSRAPLSRALNARRDESQSKPRGGGRAPAPDAGTRRALLEASDRRDKAVTAAADAFLDTVAGAIDERRITVSATAELLELHRTTLLRALSERAARRELEIRGD